MKITNLSKIELREILMAERRRISFSDRQLAANNAASLLLQSDLFQQSQQIACYYPINNEFDCLPIIETIWLTRKNSYLPVLSKKNGHDLDFILYEKDTVLRPNRYNIPEPVNTKHITLDKLDLVVVPLLGFDLQGNRLGMGAGYYDRTFQLGKWVQRPVLLGLAYESQCVSSIPSDNWDVKLDGVLTEQKLVFYTPPKKKELL